MFSFFKKRPDPIDEEIKRLEEASRRLDDEAANIQSQMGLESVLEEGEDENKKARMVLLPTQEGSGQKRKKNTSRLRVQDRRLRNRFFILCAVAGVLVLLVLSVIL